MVIAQQFVQEVQRFRADQVLVLTVHKPFPSFARVSAGTGADQELTAGSRWAEASEAVEAHLPRMSLNRGSNSMLYLSM